MGVFLQTLQLHTHLPSRQFSSDLLDTESSPILCSSFIVEAAKWQVEERIHEVQRSVSSPAEMPLTECLSWNPSAQRSFSGDTKVGDVSSTSHRSAQPPAHSQPTMDFVTSLHPSNSHNCGLFLQVCALFSPAQASTCGSFPSSAQDQG